MSLSAGIPIESIAKMMGHASISSTQIYAQVTDKKISEDGQAHYQTVNNKGNKYGERAYEPSGITTCKMEETA